MGSGRLPPLQPRQTGPGHCHWEVHIPTRLGRTPEPSKLSPWAAHHGPDPSQGTLKRAPAQVSAGEGEVRGPGGSTPWPFPFPDPSQAWGHEQQEAASIVAPKPALPGGFSVLPCRDGQIGVPVQVPLGQIPRVFTKAAPLPASPSRGKRPFLPPLPPELLRTWALPRPRHSEPHRIATFLGVGTGTW